LINWLVPFRCSRKSLYFPRVYISLLSFASVHSQEFQTPSASASVRCQCVRQPQQLEMSLEDIMFAAFAYQSRLQFQGQSGIKGTGGGHYVIQLRLG
jgi:hypothetical protein